MSTAKLGKQWLGAFKISGHVTIEGKTRSARGEWR
jgi:hypothetical protein